MTNRRIQTFHKSQMFSDFTSPEGALATLQDAYRSRDIEAAVAARCFRIEAFELLKSIAPDATDDEAVSLCAEVLELGFRKERREQGFPEIESLKMTVVRSTNVRDGLVEMWEEVQWPGGVIVMEIMHAALTSDGWRIITMPVREGSKQ